MNRNYSFVELGQHTDEYVEPVKAYLDFLTQGDGKKPHCPFTGITLQKKQFYYHISEAFLFYEEFTSALNEMVNFIEKIDDRLAVVGIVYADKENYQLDVAEQVEIYRKKHRIDLISRGLTTAWVHPRNKLGSHTDKKKPEHPLWVSEVPLLMVRKLDKGDESFMVTKDAKVAFINGMDYPSKIDFVSRIEFQPEKKIEILLDFMSDTRGYRLSSVKSINFFFESDLIHYVVLKNDEKIYLRNILSIIGLPSLM